jgi:hypothetical protein
MTAGVARVPLQPSRGERAVPVAARVAVVEGRRMLLGPLTAVGLLVSALLTWAAAAEGSFSYLLLMGAGALPLALTTLLAANLAALRPRRDRADELFDTLPAPAIARHAGIALALLGPAALGGGLALAQATVLGAWDGLEVNFQGQTATPTAADLAQAPALVLACGALGLALGRWVPTLAAALVGVVAILAASVPIVSWGSEAALRWLFPPVSSASTPGASQWGWPCNADQPGWCAPVVEFHTTTLAWHAGYLLALAGLAVGVALLRDRRPPVLVAATAVAAAGVVATAALQVG